MNTTQLIEIIDYTFSYFDLETDDEGNNGFLPNNIYPGVRETDNVLAVTFVEDTGELVKIKIQY